jgi:hypothetical protein
MLICDKKNWLSKVYGGFSCDTDKYLCETGWSLSTL